MLTSKRIRNAKPIYRMMEFFKQPNRCETLEPISTSKELNEFKTKNRVLSMRRRKLVSINQSSNNKENIESNLAR